MSKRLVLESFVLDLSSLPSSSQKYFKLIANEKSFSSSWRKSDEANITSWHEPFYWLLEFDPVNTTLQQMKVSCEIYTKGVFNAKVLFRGAATFTGPSLQDIIDKSPVAEVDLASMGSALNVSAKPIVFKFQWRIETLDGPAPPLLRGTSERVLEIQRLAATMTMTTNTDTHSSSREDSHDEESGESSSEEEGVTSSLPPLGSTISIKEMGEAEKTKGPMQSRKSSFEDIQAFLSKPPEKQASFRGPISPEHADIDSEEGDASTSESESSAVDDPVIEQVNIDDFYAKKELAPMNMELKKPITTPAPKSPTNPLLNKFKSESNPLLLKGGRSPRREDKSPNTSAKDNSVAAGKGIVREALNQPEPIPVIFQDPVLDVKPPVHPSTSTASSLLSPQVSSRLQQDSNDAASVESQESVHDFNEVDDINSPKNQSASAFFSSTDDAEDIGVSSFYAANVSDDEDEEEENSEEESVKSVQKSAISQFDSMDQNSSGLFPLLVLSNPALKAPSFSSAENPFFSAVSDSESDGDEGTANDDPAPPAPTLPVTKNEAPASISRSADDSMVWSSPIKGYNAFSAASSMNDPSPTLLAASSPCFSQSPQVYPPPPPPPPLTNAAAANSQFVEIPSPLRQIVEILPPPPPSIPPPPFSVEELSKPVSTTSEEGVSSRPVSLSYKLFASLSSPASRSSSPTLEVPQEPVQQPVGPPTEIILSSALQNILLSSCGEDFIDDIAISRRTPVEKLIISPTVPSPVSSPGSPAPRSNSRSALVSLFDPIEVLQETSDTLSDRNINFPLSPGPLISGTVSTSSVTSERIEGKSSSIFAPILSIGTPDKLVDKSATADRPLDKPTEKVSLIENNRRRSLSVNKVPHDKTVADRPTSTVLDAIKAVTSAAKVEGEERKQTLSTQQEEKKVLNKEEKSEYKPAPLSPLLPASPLLAQSVVSSLPVITSATLSQPAPTLYMNIMDTHVDDSSDEASMLVSKVPFASRPASVSTEPTSASSVPSAGNDLTVNESVRRGSNKIRELAANAEGLLKRTLADKEQGIDVLTAVRRSSMVKSMQQTDSSNDPLAISIPPDSSTTNNSPFSSPNIAPRLLRSSSARKLSQGSNSANSSAFNMLGDDCSPQRSASGTLTVDMLSETAETKSVNGAKKRGAITALPKSSSLSRASPVVSLWSKDFTGQNGNMMLPDELNGLFDIEGSQDDDSISLSVYSATGSSALGSALTPLMRSVKSSRRSSIDRKSSRADILQALEKERASITPLSPNPTSFSKVISDEESKLAQTVLNFTSTIKRTMSQASILSLDPGNKEASPNKSNAAGNPTENNEAAGEKKDSPKKVDFPDLEDFPDEDGDEGTLVFAADDDISSRLRNPLSRRSSLSNNEAVGSVTGNELGSFHTFQAVNRLFPAIGEDNGEKIIKPIKSPPLPLQPENVLHDYFQLLGDALHPGVLRVFRLIELGMNNGNFAYGANLNGALPAAPLNLPHTPIPRRRASLTVNSQNTTSASVSPSTTPTNMTQSRVRSSSVSPALLNNADTASVASRSSGHHYSTAHSYIGSMQNTHVVEQITIVPVREEYKIQDLLEIVVQKHNIHNTDAFHLIKAALAKSLLYEQPDEVFYAAEYLYDVFRAHVMLFKGAEDGERLSPQPNKIDVQEVYRCTRTLLLAFGAEEKYMSSLKSAKEQLQSAIQHQILRSTYKSDYIDQIVNKRLSSSNTPTLFISAVMLKTEAASISAQMMVYHIPCNLALIEFLCKLSTIREAIHLHITHYKSQYKSSKGKQRSDSTLLYSMTANLNSAGGALYNHEDYKFLKAFMKVIDIQLNLEIALVDPILNRFGGSNNQYATSHLSLTQRIHDAIRDLYVNKQTGKGGDESTPPPTRSRYITGKSLVSKVQLLLGRAEDLIYRMQVYQEQYMSISHHHRPNVSGGEKLRKSFLQPGSVLEPDYSSSDSDEEREMARGRREEKVTTVNEGSNLESLLIPLQDLLKQKEEIKKKISSFHHTYLEEINHLIKQCLHSLPSHHGQNHTYPAEETPLPNQGTLVTIQNKVFLLQNGLDSLSNRLWEQSLRTNEVPFVSLMIKSQCTVLLKSIYQHWPGLTMRVPNDPTPTQHTPDANQRKALQRSYSNLSLKAGENANNNVLSPSPIRSGQQTIIPQLQAVDYESKYSKELILTDVDFNHPKTLRAIGFTLNQLWESQCYSWSQLLSAGYPLSYFKQLRNAVNTAQNTATMGTQSTVSLDGHEATPWQCHLTVLELRKAGYSIAQCKAAGFDVPSLLAGGFTELEVVNSQMFSIRELQRAGCDIQRLALKELFEQTNGKHWRNRTNWCSVSPIATWFGAHVDGRGIVVKIDLRGNALTGQLPVSLCLLTGLEYLDLSGNMLSGLLSESVWANFSNLKDLWLDRNEFTPQEARLNKAMLSKVLPKCRVRI